MNVLMNIDTFLSVDFFFLKALMIYQKLTVVSIKNNNRDIQEDKETSRKEVKETKNPFTTANINANTTNLIKCLENNMLSDYFLIKSLITRYNPAPKLESKQKASR